MSYMCEECRYSFINEDPCKQYEEDESPGATDQCLNCSHGQRCHTEVVSCPNCHGHGTIAPDPRDFENEDECREYLAVNGEEPCMECQGSGVIEQTNGAEEEHSRQVALGKMLKEADGLEPDYEAGLDGSEYVRGMFELIARCFPKWQVCTGETAREYFKELKDAKQ